MRNTILPPFGPDVFCALSRELYVGNEADTDEYRETQPEKGLRHMESALAYATPEEATELHRLTVAWLASAGVEATPESAYSAAWDLQFGAYEGADGLVPMLSLAHDILWRAGLHPYYATFSELVDFLEPEIDELTREQQDALEGYTRRPQQERQ